MNGLNQNYMIVSNQIKELRDDNKRLVKRISDLENQLAATKEEIKLLQEHIFGFEDKSQIASSDFNQNELGLSEPFVFYKLSNEELSVLAAMNNKTSEKIQSTPITDFRITEKGGKVVLKQYIGNSVDVVIPDKITDIAPMAFEDCKSIKSIILPTTIKTIRNNKAC